MADGIKLTHFGKIFDFRANVPLPEHSIRVDCRNIQFGKLVAALAGRA